MNRFHLQTPAIIVWAVILAMTLAVMTPGLNGSFFFDDNPNIVENSAVHIKSLSLDSLLASTKGAEAGPLGRPVSVMSFALTHYFFGLDPFAFKAVNLAIHVINGLLAAWLVVLLLRHLRRVQLSEESKAWLPLWVASAWLVHPINVVPVLLAVQRMTLLAGMFMLLALISHLKGVSAPSRRARWGWLGFGWLVFWPLSVMSKETGLLFPLYVLVITFFSGSTADLHKRTPRWVIPASLLFLGVIGATMLSFLGRGWLDAGYAMRPFSLYERLLTETRVLWFYAAQIVIPDNAAFGLYHDDIPLSTGFVSPPQTLLAVIGWGAVVAGLWFFRERQPVLCFAVSWFLVGHSLESTFVPLEIAHEYRNYLPALGLLFGVGYVATNFLQKLKLDHRLLTTGLVAAVPVMILALFTWTRADQMGNPLVGTQIEVSRHPQSARANYSAALTLMRAGYGDAGDPIGAHYVQYYLQRAGKEDPSFKLGYLGLIAWGCASRRSAKKEWIDEFAARLEHAPLAPADRDIPDNLLKQLVTMPTCLNRADALRLFAAGAANRRATKALQANFLEDASEYELRVSLDPGSARNYLLKALSLSPGDRALRWKLNTY